MAAAASTSSVFECIDDETTNLILELQLLDIEELQQSSKGKGKEGQATDESFATALLRENIENLQTFFADQRMTRSIAEAVQADGTVVAQTILEEEIVCADHALAHRVNGSNVTSEINLQLQDVDDVVLSKLAGRYVSESVGRVLCPYTLASFDDDDDDDGGGGGGDERDEGDEADAGESSERARARQKAYRGTPDRRCEACRDDKKFFDVLATPCGHEYCQDCLKGLFEAALTDESLFPPRCCRQAIDIESVRIFLTPDLLRRFEESKIEFSSQDRTYCSRSTCSAFIHIEDVAGDVGRCAHCNSETCTICKAAAHGGDCPEDPALQTMLDLATRSGWQRCYSCHRMVELELGCNHITCPCNAQFCYVCGSPWKTCSCPQWDEQMLEARANQLVVRDVPRMAIDNPARAVRIERAVGMLRDRHNCTHDRWAYVQGPHQCEECYHNLRQYIFECRQCRVQACNRCRRNRL